MTNAVEARMVGALHARKAGTDQIVYSRRFPGSPDAIFTALTAPDVVMQWMRSRDQPITACEGEAQVGGQTVHLWQNDGEQPTRLTLIWLEIARPKRLVNWQVFEDWPTGRAHSVVTLAPSGTQTLYTAVKTYAQQHIRDAVFSTPLPDHMEDAFTTLDGLLAAGLEDRVSAPSHHAASPDD